MYPRKQNIPPRHAEQSFIYKELTPIVSGYNVPHALSIEADATLYIGKYDKATTISYTPKTSLFIMVIVGSIQTNNYTLQQRDALGIKQPQTLHIAKDTMFLLIDQ